MNIAIYSQLSLRRTSFGTAGTKSPSKLKGDVLTIRSQINGLKKGRNQLKMSSVQFTESIVSIILGRSGLVLVTESRVKGHI